jgi:hypothetical protein
VRPCSSLGRDSSSPCKQYDACCNINVICITHNKLILCLQWHLPELDYPAQGDRRTATIDNDTEKPLWAERMNLRGEVQGPQSATIFGHRQEYLPANKSRARSMVRLPLLL